MRIKAIVLVKFCPVLFGLTSVFCAGQARADWTYSGSAGMSYTDNFDKSETNTVSDSSAQLQSSLNGDHVGPQLDTTLASHLVYSSHQHNIPNELTGSVVGALTYRLLPEYLHLNLAENFGQTRQNSLLPDFANNRSNFNVFSAGADLILPIGKRSSLLASETWSDNRFGQEEFENTRLTTSLALSYDLSDRSSLSVTASDGSTKYVRIDSINNYHIQEASLDYRYRLSKNEVDISVGKTRVKYTDGDLPSGTLLRAIISHNFGARSAVELKAGSEYSDAGNSFVLEQTTIGVDRTLLGSPIGVDAFKTVYAYLGFRVAGTNTRFNVSVGGLRRTHNKQSSLDTESRSGQFQVTHLISPRVDVFWSEVFDRQSLALSVYKPKELTSTIGLSWRLTTRWQMFFDFAHSNGTIGQDGGRYQSNAVSLQFGYGHAGYFNER